MQWNINDRKAEMAKTYHDITPLDLMLSKDFGFSNQEEARDFVRKKSFIFLGLIIGEEAVHKLLPEIIAGNITLHHALGVLSSWTLANEPKEDLTASISEL